MIHFPARPATLTAATLATLAASLAMPLAAQVVITGDRSIEGQLCVGDDCTGSETLGDTTLKLKQENVRLLFEDTSAFEGTTDWMLKANGLNAATQFFALEDVDSGTTPLRIDAAAPTNALRVASSGNVGLGTAFPGANLHIRTGYSPTVIYARDTSEGLSAQTWRVIASTPYRIEDISGSTVATPFRIHEGGGNDNAFTIAADGDIGLGTPLPGAALHVFRDDGGARLLIEEADTTATPRTLLNLVNNGRPEIVLANSDTGGEWSFGAGTNFILKQGAVGSASNAKTKLFEIDPAGNATLTGSLTTGGTTCGTGCDAVFAPGYALPSIPDHAAQMHRLGYLPNVGPTPEGAPFDVTDKLGRMLNELEHAHLYIAELERRNAALEARFDAFEARLAARD